MVSLLKAEILLRRLHDIQRYEDIETIIETCLADCDNAEICATIESAIAMADAGHLRGWDGIKMPALPLKVREWMERYASEKKACRTAKKPLKCKDSQSADDGEGGMFQLRPEFSRDWFKPYLDAGVKCGYLKPNYERKEEVKKQFYVFAKLVGSAGFHNFLKLCGLQWYGDETALQDVKISRIPTFWLSYEELKRVLETIKKSV